MASCAECKNALFDKIWGEYKCTITQHTIYQSNNVDCGTYKKGEPEEAKDVTEEE